ncbi:MAG: double zinc ribbon domain-containing protein [Planctomycetota bacterium]
MRRRLWRELLAASLDLVLPPHCPGCGAGRSDMDSGHRLCRPCRVHLERLDGGGCRRCGEPSATPGACAFDHRALRGLAFARAPFRYRGTGGALVRRLKLGGDFGALSVLELAMAEAVAPRLLPSWRRAVVVPVPLHRARRRARGFDQAELLAEAVAHRLLLRCEPGCLRRRRATMPQGDPQVLSRTQNVEGAFEVARGAAVTGERVLLVDDVATSFATARACAAELILAGVREVALLTSCRARSPMASL